LPEYSLPAPTILLTISSVAHRLLVTDAMLIGLLLLTILLGISPQISAGESGPSGLYDVDYFKLENGFEVVLKKRTHARNVAVRLVVGVGQRHFPCEKRETPHFLEHLLFMGTSKHSEAELKRVIEDHGGSWNGSTSTTQTWYQIDIFDKHLPVAIDTLHEIMTDTVITPQTIESSRAVIYRERRGIHLGLTRWLYRNGLFKSAGVKARELLLPGTGVICPGLITPEGIIEADVKEAYDAYYVPANMTLVVVGNFDRDEVASQIKSTFGKLPPKAGNGSELVTPPHMTGTKEVTGTLWPLVGADGEAGIGYRIDGITSPNYYPLWVLWKYSDRALYETFRVKEAMSYQPGSAFGGEHDYGIFVVGADVNLDKMDRALVLLEEEIEKLKQGRIEAEHLEAVKQRIVWELARSYESNSALAGYYISSLPQIKANGRLINHEASITKVTPKDIQRVANQYLRNDSRVIARETPTMTFTQFFVGFGFITLAVPGAGFYLIRRVVKWRRRKTEVVTRNVEGKENSKVTIRD